MGPGDVVGERFSVERLAGTGGMCAVYRAHDFVTQSPVALKVMHADVAVESTVRFVHEVEALATLSHPSVVRYVAHGALPGGVPWLAMEWLDGEDLEARLARGPLSIDETLALVRQVASALAEAHAHGIVHRDIKPGNLFLQDGEPGRVRVLDFGVSRNLSAVDRGNVTRVGVLVGTPGYMAPEQARGAAAIDARTDVFALGCILAECLSGRPLFEGDNQIVLLARVLLEDPPRLQQLVPDVPDALDALVAQMLARDPDARPHDGAAVVDALDALSWSEPTPAMDVAPLRESLTGGEQRWISVILAGESRLPEVSGATLSDEVTRTMHETVRDIAATYEGSPEVLVNGTVMVTLAGEGVATDRASRAARCALALRNLDATRPVVLATGRGRLSSRWPVGEVLDRAATLLDRALGEHDEVGVVPLDDVTAGLLDDRFDVVSVRGRALLRGQREGGPHGRTVLGRASPFVGRERELDVLRTVFDQCVGNSVARCVKVLAPAGGGKSRLRHEFLAAVGDRAERWTARGDALRAGSPFALAAELLRRAAGIRGNEGASLRQQKLLVRLGRHLSGESLTRVAAFLAELVGDAGATDTLSAMRAARRDPQLLADHIARAWIDWLDAECQAGPVVLALEDLQWGDLPSVQLLDGSLRALTSRPLLVLGFGRPELDTAFPDLWASRGVRTLVLHNLSRAAAERMVRAVAGDRLDARDIAELVARAGGNAFYLEELVRAVADGHAGALPETVLAMAQSRIEALDPGARQVLRAASVFGHAFWVGGVDMLVGSTMRRDALWRHLDALTARELVVRQGEGRFAGEEEFAFAQNLVREAAYATLTDDDRALGHQLALTWLEARGEPDAMSLAEHAERAGAPARAAAMYRRAAEQAMAGNDLAAAVARADRAIACGVDDATRGSLRRMQAQCHLWRGELPAAERRADEAVSLLAPGSDAWCGAADDLAVASRRLGHIERLVALLDTLMRLARAADPTPALVCACARAAAQARYAGRRDLAAAFTRWVERHRDAAVARDPSTAVHLDLFRAFVSLYEGDIGIFLEAKSRAADWFEQVGDARNAALHRMHIGCAWMEVGRYDEAARMLEESVPTGEALGLAHFVATARHNLAMALARLGRTEEALAEESLALARFEAQGDTRMCAACRVDRARILAMRHEHAEAEREARAVIDTEGVFPALTALAHAALGESLLGQGRVVEALEVMRAARRQLDALGDLEEGEGYLRLTHARALYNAHREHEARGAIAEAKAKLDARATKIRDPALRRGLLYGVPDHMRIFDLAARWGVAG